MLVRVLLNRAAQLRNRDSTEVLIENGTLVVVGQHSAMIRKDCDRRIVGIKILQRV